MKKGAVKQLLEELNYYFTFTFNLRVLQLFTLIFNVVVPFFKPLTVRFDDEHFDEILAHDELVYLLSTPHFFPIIETDAVFPFFTHTESFESLGSHELSTDLKLTQESDFAYFSAQEPLLDLSVQSEKALHPIDLTQLGTVTLLRLQFELSEKQLSIDVTLQPFTQLGSFIFEQEPLYPVKQAVPSFLRQYEKLPLVQFPFLQLPLKRFVLVQFPFLQLLLKRFVPVQFPLLQLLFLLLKILKLLPLIHNADAGVASAKIKSKDKKTDMVFFI